MTEGHPDQLENQPNQREQWVAEIIALARGLSESHEGFPFPGIQQGSYEKIKSGQEEFPGYSTPIDVLIERLEREKG